MNYEPIKCPYCFKHFSHNEVLFRSATALTEVDLDPTGRGRSIEDIELEMPDGSEKNDIISKYHLRERFLIKDDEEYNRFWETYGSTSEINSGVDNSILDYKRPLLYPSDKSVVPNGAELDVDGFVYKVADCFGKESYERVCPHCHNPLPQNYGKYPIKFLSVIGISSAGKTVFLSKLIENITGYAAKLGMAALAGSSSSRKFIQDNKIDENVPLPGGTPDRYLSQPLFYNLSYFKNNIRENKMFVIYDIAGETCVSAARILNYAPFIRNSDGMFILMDPQQFQCLGGRAAQITDAILSTLSGVFTGADMVEIPLAFCLAKSDMMRSQNLLPEICYQDVQTVNKSKFCAEDYNIISNKLDEFFESNDPSIKVSLENNYINFNYFAFTTLNCDVREDENGRKYPERKPTPKRIEEPLFWMFKKFGFIDSQGNIVDHSRLTIDLNNKIKQRQERQEYYNSLSRFKFGERARVEDEICELNQEIQELTRRINS